MKTQRKQKKRSKQTKKRSAEEFDPLKNNPGSWALISSNRDGLISNLSTTMQYKIVRSNIPLAAHFTSGQTGAVSFKLSDLSGTVDVLALFDQYRIVLVDWTLLPVISTVDSAEQQGGSASDPGLFQCAIDYDDDNAPTHGEIQQYQTYRRVLFRKPVHITFKPQVSLAVFNTLTTTGYGSRFSPWLDATNPNIPHYGVKYEYNNFTTDAEHQFQYWSCITLHVEFRGIR